MQLEKTLNHILLRKVYNVTLPVDVRPESEDNICIFLEQLFVLFGLYVLSEELRFLSNQYKPVNYF